MARFAIRLMFEWSGGCLWCADETARARFGVGPIEHRLNLDQADLDRLDALSRWHDRALDWSDPAGPSPWDDSEFDRFDAAAIELLERLRTALGDEFDVTYTELGRQR